MIQMSETFINQSTKQFATLVFRTHQGSKQTLTRRILKTLHVNGTSQLNAVLEESETPT